MLFTSEKLIVIGKMQNISVNAVIKKGIYKVLMTSCFSELLHFGVIFSTCYVNILDAIGRSVRTIFTVPSLRKESRGARNSSLAQSCSENNFR